MKITISALSLLTTEDG